MNPRPFRFALLLAAMAWLGSPAASAGAELQVVTEELPPFNMTVDGHMTGLGTELVEAVLKEAGLTASFQSMPWARAYDLALHDENVLIYSMARIPEREAQFQWIGPISATRWYLYSLAGHNIPLAHLDDAKRYQIGVVKQDASELYLSGHGFRIGENLQSSNRRELNYEKLKSGHVDLWIANEVNANWLVRQAGDDPARMLVKALPIPDLGGATGLFMAVSLKTAPEMVARLREALQRLQDNGSYAAIARKWM
jgi:polar amino acid transport system substrate-binding protein